MSSSKSSSRRRSVSKRGSEDGRTTKRKAMSSTDMRVTFENLIHSISAYSEDELDKDSVVKCLRSMYDWIVFDADMQLDLPIVPGSGQMKMWPHGAKVDTRRGADVTPGEKSSRKLQEVDEKCIINVANSVVSSNLEDHRSVKSKGEVMVAAPKGALQTSQQHFNRHPSSVGFEHPTGHTRVVPEAYAYANGFQRNSDDQFTGQDAQADYYPQLTRHNAAPAGYGSGFPSMHSGPPRPYQPQQYTKPEHQPVQSAHRMVPRYSIIGAPPPVIAEETPEVAHASVFTGKKGRKPRVGTARRAQNDDDGVPVTFADE